MKILMLTPYLPYPPASGGQIRTLNLLKYLSRNHHITLICLYKNAKEKKYASYLKSYCDEIYVYKRPEKPWQLDNILKSVFSFLPFLIVRNYSQEAITTVEHLLKTQEFDVIHAETFYIMPQIPETDIPILLVEQTIEFQVYQHFVNSLPWFLRPIFYPDIVKLRTWERHYWKKAYMVGTVSEGDTQTIHSLEPSIDPIIITNGAGDEMFVDKLEPKKIDKPVLLFMGNFSWLQNTEAAEFIINEIFPELRKKFSSVHLIIAGQNCKKKLEYAGNSGIELIDIAPDDAETVKNLYRSATLFIAPVFGPGGTNLKILAAMAAGLPVIATKVGADRLKLKDRDHALIANTPNEFIEQISTILSDKKLFEQVRQNSYKLAKEKYSWEAISKQLEFAYRKIRKNP